MAIHWKIPFKTLRAKEVLTANVYDSGYSGTAVVLKGAAQPFETQEDTSDDIFLPVRKQSGYLRIVDDGFAADGVTAFNWRDFIPTTDTDRFVTLTDASNNIKWQGYLQAQNFGATLFGNPQNREFPLQCCLSVLQGVDISASIDGTGEYLPNFAYLLLKIMEGCYPYAFRPTSIIIQGDAPTILTRVVDWANFIEWDDDNREKVARYKLYEILENFCTFWGLTARTHGSSIYLTCPDDTDMPQLYSVTVAQLLSIAEGDTVTLTSSAYDETEISGDFSDNGNKDYQMRGASKAVFDPDPNEDETVIELFDNSIEIEMEDGEWDSDVYYYNDGDKYDGRYIKTVDRYHIENIKCTADVDTRAVGGSFCLVRKGNTEEEGWGYADPEPIMQVKKSYYDEFPYISIQTNELHSFSQGFFRITGDTYIGGEKYYYDSQWFAGDKTTYMRFGVGLTREDAQWWDGEKWVSTEAKFRATLGNKKPEMFSTYIDGGGIHTHTSLLLTSTMYGYVFIEILGSDDFPLTSGQRVFGIKDFKVEFRKNVTVWKDQMPNMGWWNIKDKHLKEVEYKSENDNAIKEEVSVDSIFSSDNNYKPGYGVVLNPDGTYFEGMIYTSGMEHPEQHLVNRVTNYWATSKRKIEANLLIHNGTAATDADGVTPGHMVTIDGTRLHPISLSHKWRDDEVNMVCMEIVEASEMHITINLENVTSNAPSTVERGDSLSVTLTGVDGNKVQDKSVVVTMGGEDITSTAYNHGTKTITIAEVTGNVSITAVGRPYDAEVEWLQSSTTGGRAYIDTGVKVANTVTFDLHASTTTTTDGFILGGRTAYNNKQLCVTLDYGNGNFNWGFGNNTVKSSSVLSGSDYVCSNVDAARTLNVNGNTLTATSATFSNNYNIYLFALNNGGSLTPGSATLRMYYCKIYSWGTLVRDFIPVRDNGVGYLYDKVSGTFYGNAGSGAFTYGGDV